MHIWGPGLRCVLWMQLDPGFCSVWPLGVFSRALDPFKQEY